jgi:hypothetical protein
MGEVTKPRDESRDVWVLSMLLDDVLANGGPLEIFARSTLSPKEHPESWTRLAPHSDLLAIERKLEQVERERDAGVESHRRYSLAAGGEYSKVLRERDGWMQEAARNDSSFREACDERDEWRARAETAEKLLHNLSAQVLFYRRECSGSHKYPRVAISVASNLADEAESYLVSLARKAT